MLQAYGEGKTREDRSVKDSLVLMPARSHTNCEYKLVMIYPSEVLGLQQGGCNETIQSIRVISTTASIVGEVDFTIRLETSCCD